jgi:glycosyltransferase involved in cell wall biosynthesis
MRLLIASRGIDNIAGGVERMSAALMNEMTRRGHDVALMTWDKAGANSFFPLDGKIHWYNIGHGDFLAKATLATRLRRARDARAVMRDFKPDLILAFQDGMYMAARLYTIGMGIPVIAAERNAPSRFRFIQRGRYKDFVFQAMRFARAITVQCESYRDGYPAYLRRKITVIPNPVAPAHALADPAGSPGQPKTLLSVGRLSYQKNMEALIEAFAMIAQRFPDWTLTIVGEGEDRAKLERMIRAKNMEGRIALPGAAADVTPYFLRSHLFCLPSRWEGFPNGLAEAMAHGLPAVGFAECAGVRDLIQDGTTGALAAGNGDAKSLAGALDILMRSNERRRAMGQAGTLAIAAFTPKEVFDAWENFLRRAFA